MTGERELPEGESESGGELEFGGPDCDRVGPGCCAGVFGVKNPTWRTLGTADDTRRASIECCGSLAIADF